MINICKCNKIVFTMCICLLGWLPFYGQDGKRSDRFRVVWFCQ